MGRFWGIVRERGVLSRSGLRRERERRRAAESERASMDFLLRRHRRRRLLLSFLRSLSLAFSHNFQPPLFPSLAPLSAPAKQTTCGQKTLKTVVRFVRSRFFWKKERKQKNFLFSPKRKRSEIKTYTFVHRSAGVCWCGGLCARKREREQRAKSGGVERERESPIIVALVAAAAAGVAAAALSSVLSLFSSMPSLFSLQPAAERDRY